MLRNLLASGASALVGFGLVGALPSMSAYRGGQDGEAATRKTEAPQATAAATVVLGAADTPSLLRQAYDRLRRIRSERLEDRQRALVERASEMYRRAIKAHDAGETDQARGQTLAVLELVRAVEQARAAREVARPDPELPAPPAPPVPPTLAVPAAPAVVPLPPLPPPLDVTTVTGVALPRIPAKAIVTGRRADGKMIDHARVIAKPDGEIQTIDIVGDVKITAEDKPADQIKTVIVQDVEGKPLTIRTEPLQVLGLAAPTQTAEGLKSTSALSFRVVAPDGGPAEARAKVRQAYEAVKKARKAKKAGENHVLLDTARDLYNSARAAAEAGDHAKAEGLAQAAISLTNVPNVDPKTIQERYAREAKKAQEAARKAQAELEKHHAELVLRSRNLRKDHDQAGKELVEIQVLGKKEAAQAKKAASEKHPEAVTIVRTLPGHPLVKSLNGPVEVRVKAQSEQNDGESQTTFEIHAFKDGREIPTDQLKMEKKDKVYILRFHEKEAKTEKETKQEKSDKPEKIQEVQPRVYIQGRAEPAEAGNPDLDESIVGIGIAIRDDGGKMIVQELIPGGPAAKDGRLKTNDRIVGAEGADGKIIEFADQPLGAAVERICGPEGSKIKLVVQPAGSDERRTYELTRARIVVNPDPEAAPTENAPKDKDKGDDLPPEIQD